MAPDGDRLFVFDSGGDRLYQIALSSLVASEVPLSGDVPAGDLQIGDLAFDSQGDLLAYESTSQRVLTIDTLGVVSQSAFSFELGGSGALWVDAMDDLYA